MENIKAQNQKIIFSFLDDAGDKGFTNTTSWNFVVKGHEFNAKSPRWGIVVKKGPDVPEYITEGDYILIEPLMWTHGFKIEGTKYWATDFAKIIGSVKDKPAGLF